MFFLCIQFFVLAMLSLLTYTCAIVVVSRQACPDTYATCSPAGATNSIVPPVGGSLSGLYFDLVSSVEPQPVKRGYSAPAPDSAQGSPPTICCVQGTDCLLLQSFNLAFCWDRFTTNFFLPDGSFGNVFTGYYNSSSGVNANLISGDIALSNGQTGNIYSDTPQAKPVTSLLPVPSPWTSTGVGAAVPDSRLGAEPTDSTAAAEATTTPSINLSFPSVTSSPSRPPRPSSTVNVTDFPAYPAPSMGEPYGYGPTPTTNQPFGFDPRPDANTTSIALSTGGAMAVGNRASDTMLCVMLFMCLLHVARASSWS